MTRMSIAEAAVIVLKETDNPAVGYGDSGLLHAICEKAGLAHRGWKTEGYILKGLERRPDLFEKRYFRARHGLARYFVPRIPSPEELAGNRDSINRGIDGATE